TEDVSQVGVWMLGLIPEIHKPQVWTDRSDQEKAGPVLAQYEQRQRELHRIDTEAEASLAEHITVACEECAGLATFPTRLRGTVQVCPHCNAYIDVGETPDLEGEEEDADKPESA
ncbi:MAG: hypothetical protein K8R36_04800, partial [Planctomycetales bacterium]|nr:hypothetical protein [Planctomycetales bacterium]